MPARASAAKNVAAADHHGDLHAHQSQVTNFAGDAFEDQRVDAVILIPKQGFAR